jgi:hypothetical protein
VARKRQGASRQADIEEIEERLIAILRVVIGPNG